MKHHSFRRSPSRSTKIGVYRSNDIEHLPGICNWSNPMPDHSWSLPLGKYHPGGFGYKRGHSVHTGIDLYAPVGEVVHAVENGTIVNIEVFTGPRAESPWYNESMAVLIEGESGVVLYGEMQPDSNLRVGHSIKAGDILGKVVAVLQEDKGNGVSMLHFELYTKGVRNSVWWLHDRDQPKNLLDPTEKLLSLKVSKR